MKTLKNMPESLETVTESAVFENIWSQQRCFDLFVDKHKDAFSLVETVSHDQLALSLNLGIFRTV